MVLAKFGYLCSTFKINQGSINYQKKKKSSVYDCTVEDVE